MSTPDYKMKKKLVYHIWCPTSELTDEQRFIFNLHFQLLKYYSNIFDDVQINVACDDLEFPLINKIRHKILDIFNRADQNVYIKTVQNTQLREGKTCYEEVFAPGSEYDGIVFFGHTKGLTNVLKINIFDSIKYWVCALYWFSLNFMDECEHYMNNTEAFYGSLLNKYEDRALWIYSGSFYWTNIHNVKYRLSYTSSNTIKSLSALSRSYAELIPSILFPEFTTACSKCHNTVYSLVTTDYNPYANSLINIKNACYLHDDDYKNFIKFADAMYDYVNTNKDDVNLF